MLPKAGIVLAHGGEDAGASLFGGEGDGDGADAEVEGDLGRATLDGVVEVEPACGAEGGVAGELELFADGEDADVDAAGGFDLGRAGQDEGGLAEVGLAGDGLHLGGGEAAGVGDDGEGVAFEGAFGEDVDLSGVEGARGSGGCGRANWGCGI